MNKKTVGISLTLLAVLAATIGVLTMSAYAAAVDSNSTNNSAISTSTAASNQNEDQLPTNFGENIMMDQRLGGFMGGPRGHGMRCNPGNGNIEISSEYTANVNSILNNDTDVATLMTQGYNVTVIHPNIKTVVQADGTITTKASTATVLLQGTSGYAAVNIDVTNAKVTQIAEVTRTVIDKSST